MSNDLTHHRGEKPWIEPALTGDELDPAPVRYRIPGLLKERGNVLISSYRKTGQTTLMMHLAAALTTKAAFLGLDCSPLEWKLGYVNLAMDQGDLRQYMTDQGIELGSPRMWLQDYRGKAGRFRLADDGWRADYADMLFKEEVEALVIDPIHPVLVSSSAGVRPENDGTRLALERRGPTSAPRHAGPALPPYQRRLSSTSPRRSGPW